MSDGPSKVVLKQFPYETSPVYSCWSVGNSRHSTRHEQGVAFQVGLNEDHDVLDGQLGTFKETVFSWSYFMRSVTLTSKREAGGLGASLTKIHLPSTCWALQLRSNKSIFHTPVNYHFIRLVEEMEQIPWIIEVFNCYVFHICFSFSEAPPPQYFKESFVFELPEMKSPCLAIFIKWPCALQRIAFGFWICKFILAFHICFDSYVVNMLSYLFIVNCLLRCNCVNM